MSSIKLFQVFEFLKEEEIKKFTKFVNSGFHSESRDFSELVDILTTLKKTGFSGGSDKQSIEYISKRLGIQRNSLLTKLSQLYSVLEIFLAIRHIMDDKIKFNFTLLDYFIKEKMQKPFDYTYKETKKVLEGRPFSFHTVKNFYEMYVRKMQNAFFSGNYTEYHEMHRQSTNFMILDFLLNLLQMSIDTAQQRLNGIKAENLSEAFTNKTDFEKVFHSFMERDKEIYNLAMTVYFLFRSYEESENHNNFAKAREYHLKIANKSDMLLNTYLYTVQINICILNINKGDFRYVEHMFGIINEKLKKGIFDELKGSNTPINHFRDYVVIALNLGKIAWARNFVINYSKYLPEDNREDEVNLSTALIMLEQKKHAETLKFLDKVKKNNFIYYTDSSLTKTRCYYENEDFVAAFDEIARLKSYIDYHKEIPSVHSKNAMQTIKDISMLIKYKSSTVSKQDIGFYFHKRDMLKKWIKDELISNKIRLK